VHHKGRVCIRIPGLQTAGTAAVARDVMVYWLNINVTSFTCPPGYIDLDMIQKSMETFIDTHKNVPRWKGAKWEARMRAQAQVSASDLLNALTGQVGQIRWHDLDNGAYRSRPTSFHVSIITAGLTCMHQRYSWALVHDGLHQT
jgi:hypothetical protein